MQDEEKIGMIEDDGTSNEQETMSSRWYARYATMAKR